MRKIKPIPADFEIKSDPRQRPQFSSQLVGLRRAARMANRIVKVSREEGTSVMVEAAEVFLEQQMMQSLFELVKPQQKEEDFDTPRWHAMLKMLGEAAKNRGAINDLSASDGKNGQKANGDGVAVTARVREMLGLPPAPPPRPLPMPPDPAPTLPQNEWPDHPQHPPPP